MKLDPDDETIIADCKAGGAVLVTWDRVMRQACGGITPYEAMDQAQAKAEQAGDTAGAQKMAGLRAMTPDELVTFADKANKTWAQFRERLVISPDIARLVHDMRVEEDYSWRAVARTVAAIIRAPWGGNQFAGMALCEHAAKMLGQDFMAPPWN